MVRRGEDLLGTASTPGQIQQVIEENMGKADEAGVRIAAAQRLSRPEAVEETEHFLAPYASLLESNPRSMKRLVNAFGLQYASNLISGLDVPLDSLARWTILEQRWPRLAELLCTSPDLADAFADESPGDRIPEPLRSLFTRTAIRQVLGGDGDATRLDREALSRLVGEPPALGVPPGARRARYLTDPSQHHRPDTRDLAEVVIVGQDQGGVAGRDGGDPDVVRG